MKTPAWPPLVGEFVRFKSWRELYADPAVGKLANPSELAVPRHGKTYRRGLGNNDYLVVGEGWELLGTTHEVASVSSYGARITFKVPPGYPYRGLSGSWYLGTNLFTVAEATTPTSKDSGRCLLCLGDGFLVSRDGSRRLCGCPRGWALHATLRTDDSCPREDFLKVYDYLEDVVDGIFSARGLLEEISSVNGLKLDALQVGSLRLLVDKAGSCLSLLECDLVLLEPTKARKPKTSSTKTKPKQRKK